MGDRTGSREPKLGSLKKSKKNPGAPTGRTKRPPKVELNVPTLSAPPPPPGEEPYFECAFAALSRQFDRDREKVLARAKSEGVCAIVCWFSDIEKLDPLLDLCKSNQGLCYLLAGIHPDNIERTNKKSHDIWLAKVEEIAKQPTCIGIISGLNLSREIGTHFAQESLLRSACGLADKLLLPLVLHVAADGSSLEKVIEILKSEGWTAEEENGGEILNHRRCILHDALTACGSDGEKVQMAVDAGFHLIISASGITNPDVTVREKAIGCLSSVPINRILSGTDSPWRTPQNLPDPYLRTLRNEPSNIKSLIEAIAAAAAPQMPFADFAATIRANACAVFGMDNVASIASNGTNCVSATYGDIPPTIAEEEGEEGGTEVIVAVDTISAQDFSLAEADDPVAAPCVQAGPLPPSKNEEALAGETDESAADNRGEALTLSNTKSELPISGRFFGCQRCRCRLFLEEIVVTHGLEAVKTVFKVGDEGLCASAVFIPCENAEQLAGRTRLVSRGAALECGDCGWKLGKFYDGSTSCPCGAVVQGPVAKVITGKVDFFDDTMDTEELLARCRIEADEANLEEDSMLYGDDESGKKKTKKKNKIKALKNKGNFSTFRNKTFIPNYSRSAAKKQGEGGALEDTDKDEDQAEEESDEEEFDT